MNWRRILEVLRHPVTVWAWRVHATNRRLRCELDDAKHELAVARCRETRWRRHATLVSEGNPEHEWCVARQLWSDEVADFPEIDDHQRNTFPRSLP